MFNVGDYVRIKDNANEISHNSIGFASDMLKYRGQEHKIIKRENSFEGVLVYKLEDVTCENDAINDDGHWMWVEEWLETIEGLLDDSINISSDDLIELFK